MELFSVPFSIRIGLVPDEELSVSFECAMRLVGTGVHVIRVCYAGNWIVVILY